VRQSCCAFSSKRDLASVGAAFGISEDAPRKRVSRAIEKLRGLLLHKAPT